MISGYRIRCSINKVLSKADLQISSVLTWGNKLKLLWYSCKMDGCGVCHCCCVCGFCSFLSGFLGEFGVLFVCFPKLCYSSIPHTHSPSLLLPSMARQTLLIVKHNSYLSSNLWCSVEMGFLQNKLRYQCWIYVWSAIPSAPSWCCCQFWSGNILCVTNVL